ncbi:hypothetical protein EVAR_95531_1 [Eumeta japonica]|uniref:Uncharacterized protein n=1 Tax=Eumeta variegata TaxID=151549 RepID=A0A4C1UIV9_EUMVA|nr:hypothetical protein EVAR_95531_1 [Eumeta japonica]
MVLMVFPGSRTMEWQEPGRCGRISKGCNDSTPSMLDAVYKQELIVSYTIPELLTYSSDFGAARLDPCELRIVLPYTYTLSERAAELHGKQYSRAVVECADAEPGLAVDLELGETRSSRASEATIDADLGATAGESKRASC